MFRLAATVLTLLVSPPTPPDRPPPEVEVVVLAGGRLAEDMERLLGALEADGEFRRLTSGIEAHALSLCLGDDHELTPAQRACIREAMVGDERGVPRVAVAVSYTRARGAWQHMECVGSSGAGVQRHIYVRDFDHPRPDVGPRVRAMALQCIQDALSRGGAASP